MPWVLRGYQQTQQLHFITFSCYRRQPYMSSAPTKRMFEEALERARRKYGLLVFGYVVMPEHVHLLVSEPEGDLLSTVMQAIKQSVARRMIAGREHFWQARYYDFNVCSQPKVREKLRYMHRNPVKRGLVERPEDWPWSSFRHYLTGEIGAVEIESEWTWRRRRSMGIELKMRVRENPRPTKRGLYGAPA
jgi:putative transposase